MNKKILAGAIVALAAAGIAVFIYNKRKSRLSIVAEDAYDSMQDAYNYAESQSRHFFS